MLGILEFHMSVIKHVLEEEFNRLLELAENYENKLDKLPRGSLSKKVRNNKIYLYRAFRQDGKIHFIYIGREDSEKGIKALSHRKERLKYQNLLKQVKSDIKELKRALNGYK